MSSTTKTEAPDAGREILAALGDLPATAPTACEGWTSHHIAAHLAAGSKELADLIEDHLDGQPPRPTRGFEEREAPFRALDHDELLNQLAEQSKRKLAIYDMFTTADDPAIEFTGTRVTADELTTHSRSEASIHRWDLVGDDDTSSVLLAQPELTAHAVKILNRMPILNESAQSLGERVPDRLDEPIRIVYRSPDQHDVVLETTATSGLLAVVENAVDPDVIVNTDAANRLLVLWGRRSSTRPIDIDGTPDIVDALPSILWPNATTWPPTT